MSVLLFSLMDPISTPPHRLGMDIDYAKMRGFFAQDTNLLRAYYYTALPEDREFSPLRLIDWLDYNGYAVVSKLTREFTDPETGKRRVKGNMDELALDIEARAISTMRCCFLVTGTFAVCLRMSRAWR